MKTSFQPQTLIPHQGIKHHNTIHKKLKIKSDRAPSYRPPFHLIIRRSKNKKMKLTQINKIE